MIMPQMPRSPNPTRLLGAIASLCLAGCTSPDPPLLTTELPNGYCFNSNGGSYGYIRKPPGMLGAFGRQDDGSERWCEEFGWEGALVVCRMRDEADPQAIRDLGYFVLDTWSNASWLATDRAEAEAILRQHGVAQMPALARRYWRTQRR